jgi:hypothetical protein
VAKRILVKGRSKRGKTYQYYRTVSGLGAAIGAAAGEAAKTAGRKARDSQKTNEKGRTSQSAEKVAANGLRWGGKKFHTVSSFDGWLKSKGSSFAAFSKVHPEAAKGLKMREQKLGGKRRLGRVKGGRIISSH